MVKQKGIVFQGNKRLSDLQGAGKKTKDHRYGYDGKQGNRYMGDF